MNDSRMVGTNANESWMSYIEVINPTYLYVLVRPHSVYGACLKRADGTPDGTLT